MNKGPHDPTGFDDCRGYLSMQHIFGVSSTNRKRIFEIPIPFDIFRKLDALNRLQSIRTLYRIMYVSFICSWGISTIRSSRKTPYIIHICLGKETRRWYTYQAWLNNTRLFRPNFFPGRRSSERIKIILNKWIQTRYRR